MGFYNFFGYRPYVSVAARQRNAEREIQKLKKKGHPVSPVMIQGRAIARTFWGKAWCENLESYSDFSNRLPRGRTYVRNGSVVDLQIAPGEVTARVAGSKLYQVTVKVAAVPNARWTSICTDCAGAIDSLVELLQGRFSKGVMERICQQQTGLFPAPPELEFSCSCPDWASMCKHVAAVFYGIGARLDEKPELLFKLRKVDEKHLIAKASKGLPLAQQGPSKDKVLVAEGLSELFGLELGAPEDVPANGTAPAPKVAAPSRRAARRRAEPQAAVASTKSPTPRISKHSAKRHPNEKSRKKSATRTLTPASSSIAPSRRKSPR